MLKSIILAAMMISTPLTLWGDDYASKGKQLEEKMWADMKDQDWEAVNSQIAPYFQSVHEDGARDKTQEMKLIKNLDLGNYTLSKFQVTEGEDDDTLIVTYWVSVEETIDNKRLSTKPAARLSVWQKNDDDKWQWAVHANLNPLK